MIEEYEDNYLENIIHGNEVKRSEDIATTARNYLCRSFQASKMAERKFDYFQRIKKEQELILEQLCSENNWRFLNLTQYNFLTEGGESKIYFKDKSNYVINTKRFDYINPEIGIAIEDLHDENVLTVDDNLFFIDTIFLLK